MVHLYVINIPGTEKALAEKNQAAFMYLIYAVARHDLRWATA